MNDYRLTPNEQCVNYIIARTSYNRCGDDEDDVRFVLAQHLQLFVLAQHVQLFVLVQHVQLFVLAQHVQLFVLAQHLQLGINCSSSLNRHSDTFS